MNSRQLGLILGMSAITAVSHAAVLKVPQQYPTVQAAIDAAAEADTVKIAPGTYYGGFSIQGKAITLAGYGASPTILSADSQGTVLTISSTGSGLVTLSGLTVTQGRGTAVKVSDSNLTVRNTVMTENLGCKGIALHATQSTVTLVRNRIESNPNLSNCEISVVLIEGSRGTGEFQVSGNVFQNQSATGLVLKDAGTATVSNNIFRNHDVPVTGFADSGAFKNDNTALTLQNNLFVNNTGPSAGAAYMDVPPTLPVKVTGNSFVGNQGGHGGALVLEGWGADLFVIQNNQFDAPAGQPQIKCTLPRLIDRSNVTPTESGFFLDDTCAFEP